MHDGPLSLEEFEDLLAPYTAQLEGGVAVAVSGGPDSMALVWLLSQLYPVRAVTVDHGLRPDSAQEAAQVGTWLSSYPNIQHSVLTRAVADRGDSKVQEDARHDRYAMMAEYCRGAGVNTLCVAHHQEDQAETVLFRLAKGSGLDGLSGMRAVQDMGGITLLRPLLDVLKQRLVATCQAHGVPFVIDPSNQKTEFARVRLRQSADILAAEGLSPKRLAVTAKRLARAREALEFFADQAFESMMVKRSDAHRIEFSDEEFDALPDEISLRCLVQAYKGLLAEGYAYGPRMEKLEDLHRRLKYEQGFKGATLGGCMVKRDHGKQVIIVELEQKDATLN